MDKTYKIGGTQYPIRKTRHCAVCTSNRRVDIENAILMGVKTDHIVKLLCQGDDGEITHHAIANHIGLGHMPYDGTFQRVAADG